MKTGLSNPKANQDGLRNFINPDGEVVGTIRSSWTDEDMLRIWSQIKYKYDPFESASHDELLRPYVVVSHVMKEKLEESNLSVLFETGDVSEGVIKLQKTHNPYEIMCGYALSTGGEAAEHFVNMMRNGEVPQGITSKQMANLFNVGHKFALMVPDGTPFQGVKNVPENVDAQILLSALKDTSLTAVVKLNPANLLRFISQFELKGEVTEVDKKGRITFNLPGASIWFDLESGRPSDSQHVTKFLSSWSGINKKLKFEYIHSNPTEEIFADIFIQAFTVQLVNQNWKIERNPSYVRLASELWGAEQTRVMAFLTRVGEKLKSEPPPRTVKGTSTKQSCHDYILAAVISLNPAEDRVLRNIQARHEKKFNTDPDVERVQREVKEKKFASLPTIQQIAKIRKESQGKRNAGMRELIAKRMGFLGGENLPNSWSVVQKFTAMLGRLPPDKEMDVDVFGTAKMAFKSVIEEYFYKTRPSDVKMNSVSRDGEKSEDEGERKEVKIRWYDIAQQYCGTQAGVEVIQRNIMDQDVDSGKGRILVDDTYVAEAGKGGQYKKLLRVLAANYESIIVKLILTEDEPQINADHPLLDVYRMYKNVNLFRVGKVNSGEYFVVASVRIRGKVDFERIADLDALERIRAFQTAARLGMYVLNTWMDAVTKYCVRIPAPPGLTTLVKCPKFDYKKLNHVGSLPIAGSRDLQGTTEDFGMADNKEEEEPSVDDAFF